MLRALRVLPLLTILLSPAANADDVGDTRVDCEDIAVSLDPAEWSADRAQCYQMTEPVVDQGQHRTVTHDLLFARNGAADISAEAMYGRNVWFKRISLRELVDSSGSYNEIDEWTKIPNVSGYEAATFIGNGWKCAGFYRHAQPIPNESGWYALRLVGGYCEDRTEPLTAAEIEQAIKSISFPDRAPN